MAASKSWLMPIDRCAQRAGGHALGEPRGRAARAAARTRAVSAPGPRSRAESASARRAARRAPSSAASSSRRASSASAPNFVASPARSTCTSTSGDAPCGRRPRRRAAAADRPSRPSECRRTAPAAFFALFDCRWPMRCHLHLECRPFRRSSAGLPAPCSRRTPAARPPRRRGRGRRRRSSRRRPAGRRQGSRPARRAAASIRDLTDVEVPRDGVGEGQRGLLDVRLQHLEVRLPLPSRSGRSARSSCRSRTPWRRRAACRGSGRPCRA